MLQPESKGRTEGERRFLAKIRAEQKIQTVLQGRRVSTERPAPSIPDHELFRRIGGGAYGEVWLAKNVVGTFRAVKVVYRDSFHEDRPFEREFRGIQKFEPVSRSNDGLMDILQIGRNEQEGWFYYVMELADDFSCGAFDESDDADKYVPTTLQEVVRARGRLPFEECLQFALSLTLALGHLHRRGLIHRDIKPSNIIFIGGIPKLADIGLVTEVEEAHSLVGTEGFIPPEGPNSPQADIYSLGKVLYEISMGKDRTEFPEPVTALGEDSGLRDLEELNAVILKACASDARDRYQSAEELHVDLALLQNGKSVKWRRILEKRLAYARKVVGIIGLIALFATGAFLYQRHQTRENKRLRDLAEDLAARGQIQNAENLLQNGDSALGVAHLAHVLRNQPGNRVAAERILSSLAERSFPRLAAKPLLHNSRVLSAHFSPDGKQIATISDDNSVRVWNWREAVEASPAFHVPGRINSIHFSPDSSRIVIAAHNRKATVLSAKTGLEILPAIQHDAPVLDANFNSNGTYFATASADGRARIFESETGSLKQSYEHKSAVRAIDFSSDGKFFGSISEDGHVRIWTLDDRKLKYDFLRRSSHGISLLFSPNSRLIAASFQNNETDQWEVQIWDLEKGASLPRPLACENRIFSIDFSSDSKHLVTGDADNVARVWNAATGENLQRLQHAAIVYSAAFNRAGKSIVTASVDQTARLWDAASGFSLAEPFVHYGRVINAEFSPDGRHILTASWDKLVNVWEVPVHVVRNKTLPHVFWVTLAEFDRTGERFMTATSSAIFSANNINTWQSHPRHSATIWHSVSTNSKAVLFPQGHQVIAAQFTDAGAKALVVTGLFSSEGRVWDLENGIPVGKSIQASNEITVARFSANGSRVAVGSRDGYVMIYDAQPSPPRRLIKLKHAGAVNSLRFSSNGQTLLTASHDGFAKLWNLDTGQMIGPGFKHNAEVWRAQFSSQGDRIVTASMDNSARVWSTNGALISFLPHRAPVEYAEFSPDGLKVGTASGDRTARIWDAATGNQLVEPLEHKEVVLSARFSLDGLRLITASMDRTAQIWDAATGLKLSDPLRHDQWVLSASFSPDGKRAITASSDKTAKVWPLQTTSLRIPATLPSMAENAVGQRLNPRRIPEPVGQKWDQH